MRNAFGSLFVLSCLALSCASDGSPPDASNAGTAGIAGAAAGSGGASNAGSGGIAGSAANGGSVSNAGSTAAGGTSGAGGTAGSRAGAAGSNDFGGSGGANAGGADAGGANAGGRSGSSGSASGGTAGGGSGGGKSTPIPVRDLPVIEEMPDPLTMNDGTQVTTLEQWRVRRQEMIQILEDYTYGHMPPPPGNVTAETVTPTRTVTAGGSEAEYRMLRLSFGPDGELGFDLGIFTPAGGDEGQKYPTLVYLTQSASQNSLGAASAALARGYAVATVPYQQLGADAANWADTGFFKAYPDYDWRDFSAWAWGLSRAIDYLVTDASIAADQIMMTGVSRLGQAVLLAGAFDERVALTAPVAGGMAFRFSGEEMGGGLGQGITEVVDQNTYWFGPRLPEFRNQTPKLPSDQHWLPALTAPRLFLLCNSLADQYGRAYAAAQTYLEAKPVYALLGADENLGVHFREGGHGMTAEDWTALLDFSDQYLLGQGGSRRFDVLPSADKLP